MYTADVVAMLRIIQAVRGIRAAVERAVGVAAVELVFGSLIFEQQLRYRWHRRQLRAERLRAR
jgi:hypothetical protein